MSEEKEGDSYRLHRVKLVGPEIVNASGLGAGMRGTHPFTMDPCEVKQVSLEYDTEFGAAGVNVDLEDGDRLRFPMSSCWLWMKPAKEPQVLTEEDAGAVEIVLAGDAQEADGPVDLHDEGDANVI